MFYTDLSNVSVETNMKERNQSPDYVDDDAIINLRRPLKPENKNTSLKGCNSLDELFPYLDIAI